MGQVQMHGGAVIHTAAAVEALPWLAFDGLDDVQNKVLWELGDSHTGLMRLAEGGTIAPHRHHTGHHHVWVIEGHCSVLGTTIGAGSYAHVPAGVDHEIAGVGSEGCTLLYLYLADHAS
jgi:quercetin dioxygenase-like cupin family protein